MSENDGVVSIAEVRRSAGNVEEGAFESKLMRRLTQSQDSKAFISSWLDIQCRTLEGVVRAAVILRDPATSKFAPVAIWPEGVEGSPKLAAVAETALTERKLTVDGLKRARRQDPVYLGQPVMVDDEIYAVIAIEAEGRSEIELHTLTDRLGWGLGWLEALARKKTFTSRARMVTVLELISTALRHQGFQGAATAVVTELATMFGCERVSVGFIEGRHMRVASLSHSATYAKKTNLIRSIEAAMDEAADQLATITFPAPGDGPFQVTRAHAELVQSQNTGTVCTIPLTLGTSVFGAMVFELPPGSSLDTRTTELCEHVARLVGPMLDAKRREDRWIGRKVADSLTQLMHRLVGPDHVALKLWAILAVVVTLFLVFAEGDYQITADASLEGKVQRALTAAVPGYIAEARSRAGDVVRKGDVLATMDDRDLRLERVKLISQRAQYENEYNQALAERQRPKVRILEAQVAQVDAQLALVDEQLSRMRLVAPFDAVVVKGDLSQSLGAPVERGSVLFELAPLDSYRIIMKVDERDIGSVTSSQTGYLALTSMPDEAIPLKIEKITPVSVVEEGRNYFRVEAAADGVVDKLRPGMEGVAKIGVDRRNLFWIWTHKLTHWVRMWIWSWWP